jgi:crotonobetainyl-CoA:carnitine CoA-transferase CaiB-like acyl-CoA transferase
VLVGTSVVNASINLPADVAGWRLAGFGADVTKIEPPGGDPVERAAPLLYAELTRRQSVRELDLKSTAGRRELDALLECADVLLTSSRPSALARLGLGWMALEERHPQLVQVAIVGHPAPDQELAGHDLTYVAGHGLLAPPAMPRTLVADMAGAERAVSTALALLIAREQGGDDRYAEVPLAEAAAVLALPHDHGLTGADGPLGGADPWYGLYKAAVGWVAVAALEPRFQERLLDGLGLETASREAFAVAFCRRPAAAWEQWARERDLPVANVRVKQHEELED